MARRSKSDDIKLKHLAGFSIIGLFNERSGRGDRNEFKHKKFPIEISKEDLQNIFHPLLEDQQSRTMLSGNKLSCAILLLNDFYDDKAMDAIVDSLVREEADPKKVAESYKRYQDKILGKLLKGLVDAKSHQIGRYAKVLVQFSTTKSDKEKIEKVLSNHLPDLSIERLNAFFDKRNPKFKFIIPHLVKRFEKSLVEFQGVSDEEKRGYRYEGETEERNELHSKIIYMMGHHDVDSRTGLLDNKRENGDKLNAYILPLLKNR